MTTVSKREMANSFSFDSGADLSAADATLMARRLAAMGPLYALFYRRPLRVVRAKGVYLYDAEDRAYLDVYNNVASVGHSNEAVAQAVSRQLTIANTHNRYLQHGVVDYAEELLETFPVPLDRVVFTNSGSEANDLAIRIARTITGSRGVVVTENAYHGTTSLIAGMSPSLGTSTPLGEDVRVVAVADLLRRPGPDAAATLRQRIVEQIDDLQRSGHGVAALLIDSILSSDGIFAEPVGVLKSAADAVHAAGGLYIADEVQSGFGRTGDSMWGFSRHGVDADLVSLGKPMGNGVPIGAVVHSCELGDRFAAATRYFNTFGGNPVSIAAASAVLHEIDRHGLLEHATKVGQHLTHGLASIFEGTGLVGEIRSAGLFIGVDCVLDAETMEPDAATALDIVNGLRDRHVLISAAGRDANVLKIRPPLVFQDEHADTLLDRLADVVAGLPSR